MDIFGMSESSKFARALAASEGVRVEQRKDVGVPVSSGDGSIIIGEPTIYNHGKYMVDLHREISKQMKDTRFFHKVEPKDDLGKAVKGILQSHRTEYHQHGIYEGRDRILANGYHQMVQGAGGMRSLVETVGKQNDIIGSLLYLSNEQRNDWQGYEYCEEPEELKDRIAQLRSVLRDSWTKLDSEEELQRLLSEITQLPPPQGEEGEDDGDTGDGSPSEGMGDGSPGGEGEEPGDSSQGTEGKGQGDGDSSQGTGGESGDSGEEGEDSSGDSGDTPDEGDGDEGEPTDKLGGKGASDAYKSLKDIGIIKEMTSQPQTLWDDKNVKYIPKLNDLVVKDVTKTSNDHTPYTNEIRSTLGSFTLTKKIKKYLISQSQTGYELGKTRGKICCKNISRIYTGARRPRIFKEKTQSKINTDTAIFILGDCSGSMGSSKKYVTSSACQIAMSECLSVLQIPHMMMQFSTGWNGRAHYVMKKFEERSVPRDTLITRYGSHVIHMGCNADGEAVLEASQLLAKRPERNKILIVLSDGSPAYSAGDWRYLQDVVKQIEESKSIDIMGIGIVDHEVKRYYTNNRVVNRVQELEQVLLGILKNNVTRR